MELLNSILFTIAAIALVGITLFAGFLALGKLEYEKKHGKLDHK